MQNADQEQATVPPSGGNGRIHPALLGIGALVLATALSTGLGIAVSQEREAIAAVRAHYSLPDLEVDTSTFTSSYEELRIETLEEQQAPQPADRSTP